MLQAATQVLWPCLSCGPQLLFPADSHNTFQQIFAKYLLCVSYIISDRVADRTDMVPAPTEFQYRETFQHKTVNYIWGKVEVQGATRETHHTC